MTRRVASTKGAKKKADDLFSLLIRTTRGKNGCEACGKPGPLDCAHIVSRRFSATRCDEGNAFALCRRCHMRFTDWPVEFASFVLGKIGEDSYAALRAKATPVTVDWHAEAARLTLRLAEAQSDGYWESA